MHICLPDMREVKPAQGSAFLLYNVHIDGLYHCSLRYKQLLHLHQTLSKEFHQLPPFPPKKLLPLSVSQIEERRIQLEKYLQTISQDKAICNSHIFNLFFLEAQRESTRIRESQVHLNIELVNGHKIRLQILTHDSADAILTAVCRALGLDHRYHAYFCLCLCAYDVIRDKLIIKRKLSHFESPYVTLQMAIQQHEQLQNVLQSASSYSSSSSSSTSAFGDTNNNCHCLSCLTKQPQQYYNPLTNGVTTDENSNITTATDSSLNYNFHIHHQLQHQQQQQQQHGNQQQQQAFQYHYGSSLNRSQTSSSSSSFVTHRILLRISYWDPIYDMHILNDPNALNLLFIQTVYDMKHSLMFVNRETYQQLESLLASDSKMEYILLARTLKYYNYVHFEPCISDYPKPRTKVMISIGSKELNMRVLKTPKTTTSYNTYGATATTTNNTLVSQTNSTIHDKNTLATNQVSNLSAPTTPTHDDNDDGGAGVITTNQQVSNTEQILYCTSSLVPSNYHHLITKDDIVEEEYNFKVPLIRCWRLTSLETLNSNSTCSAASTNTATTTTTTNNASRPNNRSKRKSMSFFNSSQNVDNNHGNTTTTSEQHQNSFISGSGAASLIAVLTGGSIANDNNNNNGNESCRKQQQQQQITAPQFSQYELSFEYLISKDTLKWITISSDQAIFISISLQGVVDELVSTRDGRSSLLYKPHPAALPPPPPPSSSSSTNGHHHHLLSNPNNSSNNNNNGNNNNSNNYINSSAHYQNFTYMYRDGSKKQMMTNYQRYLDDKFTLGSPINPFALTLVQEQQHQHHQPPPPPQPRRSSAMLLLSSTSSRLSSIMALSPETSTGSSAGARLTAFEIANFKKEPSPIINDAFDGLTNDDDL